MARIRIPVGASYLVDVFPGFSLNPIRANAGNLIPAVIELRNFRKTVCTNSSDLSICDSNHSHYLVLGSDESFVMERMILRFEFAALKEKFNVVLPEHSEDEDCELSVLSQT
ncbi:hypothetical protein ANN_04705 [Periplaneta americana]|uniref:Uncharacterized protein n=1 Tax=Periplaneta americana TaxID=6978 RepID=A0ABQ8TBK0_PERAM|nr:hypothetical protein ANN_04705 [Periplaneta americana]